MGMGDLAFSLFARDASLRTTLLLFDRSTKTMEKLVSLDLTRYYTVPGAVGERYETWSVYGPLTCSAYIRDTATDQTMKIRTPPGTERYGSR